MVPIFQVRKMSIRRWYALKTVIVIIVINNIAIYWAVMCQALCRALCYHGLTSQVLSLSHFMAKIEAQKGKAGHTATRAWSCKDSNLGWVILLVAAYENRCYKIVPAGCPEGTLNERLKICLKHSLCIIQTWLWVAWWCRGNVLYTPAKSFLSCFAWSISLPPGLRPQTRCLQSGLLLLLGYSIRT